MRLLRASAYLALVYVTIMLAATAVSATYAKSLSDAFHPSEVLRLATALLLVLGAVSAFRTGDSRYLILAWALVAGQAFPMLFNHPEFPDRLKHAGDPHMEALIRQGWEYSLRIGFYSAIARCTIAVLGLLLALGRPRGATGGSAIA